MKLQARGLRRSVEGRVLFDGLDLDLEEGQTVVVAGPSGAGKSQLLRLLAWLDPPDDGEVRLDGRTPVEWGPTTWRARVCLVTQQVPDYPGTPRDLLALVQALKAQEGRQGPDPVDLARGWGLPPDMWEKRWVKLSGGERQRAALAIALSRGPEVLLLDEPTSAIDPDATQAVEATLAGRTTVWVTHDEAQAARVGGRVLRLSS